MDVGLVLGSEDLPPLFLGLHRLQACLSLHAEYLLDEISLRLVHVILALPDTLFLPLKFTFQFLFGLSSLDVPNHAVQVPKEGFGVVIDIVFLLSVNSKVIGLFKEGFIDVGSFAIEVLDVELHHESADVLVDLLNECSDGLGFGIQLIETAQMGDQLNELVVYLSLVFWFLLFLGYFPVQNSKELRLEQHLVESD